MGMQTDVKSQYANASGLIIPFRTRVRAVFFGVATSTTGVVGLYDNSSIAGTYTRSTTTATVTAYNHGLRAGDWAFINWSGGTNPTNDFYKVVTAADANTFTVAVADTGDASGGATVFNDVLMMSTVSTGNDVFNIIPGEGILAENGVRVYLESSITATVYYG
jgi:hypothetical protein